MSWWRRPDRRRRPSFIDSTDYHSHILPGVDDGVKSFEDSLAILSKYESRGLKDVYLTPHIMVDIPNTTGDLKLRFDELQSRYGGSIRLHLSAENMLDELFVERLEARDLLTFGPDAHCLLVETSYFNPPAGFHDVIHSILESGYTLVLAHPERYDYMDEQDYELLHGMGVLFQMNLLSPQGYYGPLARKKARYLRGLGWYSYYGSDIHSIRMLKDLQMD